MNWEWWRCTPWRWCHCSRRGPQTSRSSREVRPRLLVPWPMTCKVERSTDCNWRFWILSKVGKIIILTINIISSFYSRRFIYLLQPTRSEWLSPYPWLSCWQSKCVCTWRRQPWRGIPCSSDDQWRLLPWSSGDSTMCYIVMVMLWCVNVIS